MSPRHPTPWRTRPPPPTAHPPGCAPRPLPVPAPRSTRPSPPPCHAGRLDAAVHCSGERPPGGGEAPGGLGGQGGRGEAGAWCAVGRALGAGGCGPGEGGPPRTMAGCPALGAVPLFPLPLPNCCPPLPPPTPHQQRHAFALLPARWLLKLCCLAACPLWAAEGHLPHSQASSEGGAVQVGSCAVGGAPAGGPVAAALVRGVVTWALHLRFLGAPPPLTSPLTLPLIWSGPEHGAPRHLPPA